MPDICLKSLGSLLAITGAHRLLVQNQFDSIDLSDNAVVRLEGFPKLPRLQALHLNNNRIIRIARNLEGEGRPASVTVSPPTIMSHELWR